MGPANGCILMFLSCFISVSACLSAKLKLFLCFFFESLVIILLIFCHSDSVLSVMVALSESYLKYLEHKAIAEALAIQVQPKAFKRYVDDSHARFTSKHHANAFQEI